MKNILSIAGSDPSGGAGIQADLKSISANGGYGMAVITALTAQNTKGVSAIKILPRKFIKQQLQSIFDDINVHSIKIGMIANKEIGESIFEFLKNIKIKNIVLDPVMIAKGGHSLIDNNAIKILKEKLIPISSLITPNLPEAAKLLNVSTPKNVKEMENVARKLYQYYKINVFLKGGHLEDNYSPDLLITNKNKYWLKSDRLKTVNTHGTGCTISSAIATYLAQGLSIYNSVKNSKDYVYKAIKYSSELKVGNGHGPLNHFFKE